MLAVLHPLDDARAREVTSGRGRRRYALSLECKLAYQLMCLLPPPPPLLSRQQLLEAAVAVSGNSQRCLRLSVVSAPVHTRPTAVCGRTVYEAWARLLSPAGMVLMQVRARAICYAYDVFVRQATMKWRSSGACGLEIRTAHTLHTLMHLFTWSLCKCTNTAPLPCAQ